ncbi:MAG: ParB N-terminal domain-containing protein, partial [Acutalibacteraceae bacterium]|nr:ParB N-terminal domain-containing protein [Acutalibacteraceae bacterium]
MKVFNVDPRRLRPYENNPRINDGAVEAVAKSIDEFGFKVPIVVDSDYVIIAGHTRLKAAERLGLKSVPVVIADDLTEEQARAFRLADNKTAELAEWDFDSLEQELDELSQDFDMSEFGFDDILEEIEEPNDVEHSTLTDKFI